MSGSTRWSRRALATAAVGVGSAAAMLLVGPVHVAGSSTAQEPPGVEPPPGEEPPTLTASLDPTTVSPGGELTYSSVDPCPVQPNMRVLVMYGPEGWIDAPHPDEVYHAYVEVEEDGSWATAIEAPPEGGGHEITAQCLSRVGRDPQTGLPVETDLLTAVYSPLDFEVVSDDPDPTTPEPPTAPAPARPVPGQPDYTG